MHWGTEYQNAPNGDQQDLAHQLLASPDIDLIIGHHVHVVQPFEKIGKKVGRLRDGQPHHPVRRRFTGEHAGRGGARVHLHPYHFRGVEVTSVSVLPTWMEYRLAARVVDLVSAAKYTRLPAARRAHYAEIEKRINGYLGMRGAFEAGLRLLPDPRAATPMARQSPKARPVERARLRGDRGGPGPPRSPARSSGAGRVEAAGADAGRVRGPVAEPAAVVRAGPPPPGRSRCRRPGACRCVPRTTRSSQAAPASAGLNSQCCVARIARCTTSLLRPLRATSVAYACSMLNGTNRSPRPCRLSTGAVGPAGDPRHLGQRRREPLPQVLRGDPLHCGVDVHRAVRGVPGEQVGGELAGPLGGGVAAAGGHADREEEVLPDRERGVGARTRPAGAVRR